MGNVVHMKKKRAAAVQMPWEVLGFDSERDMLLDDLRTLSSRIKDPSTTATALAALSKRKQEIYEQVRQLDSGENDPDSILDDSDDEAWTAN